RRRSPGRCASNAEYAASAFPGCSCGGFGLSLIAVNLTRRNPARDKTFEARGRENQMKTRLRATVAALGALAVSGTAQAQIKLGAILSISGPGAAMGVGYKGAFDLFPTEIAGQKV